MIKIEENIKKLKGLRNRLAVVALATGLTFTGSGCEKDENAGEEIGYSLMSDSGSIAGLYTYIINGHGLESNKYHFDDDFIRLMKVSEKEEYDNSDKTTAFFRENIKMVWPDCFALDNHPAVAGAFDMNLELEKLTTTTMTSFTVVNSSMTAKHDIDPGTQILVNGQQEIKKGDTLTSTAIYYEGELVAYQQTGAGSDSQNVIDATKGDVSIALQTVSEYGLLSTTETVDYQEFNEIESSLVNYTYQKSK